MKALLLDEPGTPSTLRLGEVSDPVPGPGEVRVRVRACGLNPVDVGTAANGNPAWSWPHILGLDAAGDIDAIGEGVNGFTVGQRVVFHGDLRRNGGLAEFVVTRDDVVATIPDDVSYAQAAALPCAGMTAYQAVYRRLHLSAGQTILITGGAGGVGGFAIQLAHAVGARVITTCSPTARDRVLALGADEAIDYGNGDVPARVRELTSGRGVDAVIDTRSSESATANLGLLVHGGGLVFIAGRPDLGAVVPFTIAPSVHEIALGAAHSFGDAGARKDLAIMLEDLLSRVAAGTLNPMIEREVALGEAPEALESIAAGHSHGKSVVIVA